MRFAIKKLEEASKVHDELMKKAMDYHRYYLELALRAFREEIVRNTDFRITNRFDRMGFDVQAIMGISGRGSRAAFASRFVAQDMLDRHIGLTKEQSPRDGFPYEPVGEAERLGRELAEELMGNLDRWRLIATGRFDSAKKILEIVDMEQRMAALKLYGADKLIEELHAPLLDRSERGNELYLIPKEGGLFLDRGLPIDAFFLKYKCPSTGRIYVSGIDPIVFGHYPYRNGQLKIPVRNPLTAMIRASTETLDMPVSATVITRADGDMRPIRAVQQAFRGAADLAMAWKFQITLDQYLNQLTIEA